MRRYLPEATMFFVAGIVLAVLSQRVFDTRFFVVILVAWLVMSPPRVTALFVLSIAAGAAWNYGGRYVISAFVGIVMAFAADGLSLLLIVGLSRDVVVWCLVPLAAAVGYATWRIAQARWRAYTYAVGAAFFALVYFSAPWVAEVALVTIKGRALQTALQALPTSENIFPIEKFTVRRNVVGYLYNDAGPVAPVFNFLVYDPKDGDVGRVEENFRARDVEKCKFSGHRIVPQYYAIDMDCD